LPITAEQRGALQRLVERPTATQREVRRAQIILDRAAGLSQTDTARRVRVNRSVVVRWERRFGDAGLGGLADAKGRGRKPSVALETKAAIVSRATQPPPGRTRWSVRSMARATGVSKATVQRLWAANAIKPHLTHAFKLSNDPQFEAKFWDVIGLYLQPPDKTLVPCCDEKLPWLPGPTSVVGPEREECQALERTQPGLPLGIGHVRTRTHDYTRHGTITLFAALSYLDGKIFSQTAARQTHQQWLAFLKRLALAATR
jgi:transposase